MGTAALTDLTNALVPTAEERSAPLGKAAPVDPPPSEPVEADGCAGGAAKASAAPSDGAPADGAAEADGDGAPAADAEGAAGADGAPADGAAARPSRPSDLAGRRERKSVVRLELELPETAPLVIIAGKGCKLGEIDNVALRIGKLPSKSEALKRLHAFLYGRPGAVATLKRNLREFSGFESEERAGKMRAAAARCAAAQLRELLALCDLEVSGAKDALIERLAAWLAAPAKSGRRSLVEKAAEEKRRAEKRKRAVEKAASRAERVKKASRKAPPAPAAGVPPAPELSAFDVFAQAKLGRLEQNNPGLSQADLLEHLRAKWAGLDADKRAPFEEEAESKQREQAALRKRAQVAKAASRSAKGTNASSRKGAHQQMVAAQMEDLDDDEEEEEEEEVTDSSAEPGEADGVVGGPAEAEAHESESDSEAD